MPFQPETAMSVSDEESTEEESTEEEDEPHQQESTAEEEEEEEPGPLSRLEQRRKRNCEEQGRYFDGLEVAKAAITPCTTDAAVPPEPAVAIEAPGEDLVAEVASLKEKNQSLKRRFYKEEGHRLEVQDKLTSVQESAEQEIAEAQRLATLRQDECAAALARDYTTEYALRAKVKELRATITTLKQTADLSAQGKKKRVFKHTRWKSGHEVMVRPNEPTLVRCKKCGDIFTESFMRRHFVISKGGCQSTKTRGTKSAM